MRELNKDLICKDCVHSFVPIRDLYDYWINGHYSMLCKKTAEMDESKFSPVVGYLDKNPIYRRCAVERERFTHTACGPSAKHWSPKKKKDLFKLLAR
jgi:hypothetical protein